jgi:cysteine desulfuration protein SufE
MALKNLESYIELVNELEDSGLLYQCLLDYGKNINTNTAIRVKENYVNGCQSQVWITGTCKNDVWIFKFDSDALIVKGVGQIVLDTFNNLNTNEIQSITFHQFKPIAVTLSTQRQRGLQAIINKIHNITRSGDTQ